MIQAKGEEVEIIEYLKQPPSKEELGNLARQLSIRPKDLIRKGEKLYKEKFSQEDLTDEEWLTVLSSNPILIERPVVVRGGKAVIGRPPENVNKLFE